jgi:hypothetical protein
MFPEWWLANLGRKKRDGGDETLDHGERRVP